MKKEENKNPDYISVFSYEKLPILNRLINLLSKKNMRKISEVLKIASYPLLYLGLPLLFIALVIDAFTYKHEN